MSYNPLTYLPYQLSKMTGIKAVGFGNSVMLQNVVYPISSVVTNITSIIAAGSTTIPVTSSAGFTTGDLVQFILYDGTLYTTTITVSGNNFLLPSPIPKFINGASVGGVNIAKQFASTYGLEYAATGWLRATNAQMGNCFNFANIYGFGGANSNTMLPDFGSAVLAYKPTVLFCQMLENDIRDIGASIMTVAQSIANINSVITQCQANGIFVVMGTSLPSVAFSTPTQVAAFDKINNYLESLEKTTPGLLVLPMHRAWIDNSSTTTRSPISSAVTVYTDTLLHPTSLGAQYLVTNIILPKLQNVFGQGYTEQWPGGLGDASNYISNPFMYGTAGTIFTPVTGTCPSSTQAQATATGVTTSSIVSSVVAEGLEQNWQMVWSHTLGSDAVSNVNQMRFLPVTCPAGTMVVGRAEVEINNATNLHGYNMIIDFGNNQSSRSIDFATADVDLGSLTPSGRFVLETVPMLAPASGAGTARIYFTTTPKAVASGAASGATMILHKASISAIPLPVT